MADTRCDQRQPCDHCRTRSLFCDGAPQHMTIYSLQGGVLAGDRQSHVPGHAGGQHNSFGSYGSQDWRGPTARSSSHAWPTRPSLSHTDAMAGQFLNQLAFLRAHFSSEALDLREHLPARLGHNRDEEAWSKILNNITAPVSQDTNATVATHRDGGGLTTRCSVDLPGLITDAQNIFKTAQTSQQQVLDTVDRLIACRKRSVDWLTVCRVFSSDVSTFIRATHGLPTTSTRP